MSEAEYESFLLKRECRANLLTPYETFVKDQLVACPAASAAQVHDWLKEHHSPFPKTSPKTVYNFVMAIRQKHNIPLEKAFRDYFIVDQLAYGLQVQADPIAIGFGQYHLRNSELEERRCIFLL